MQRSLASAPIETLRTTSGASAAKGAKERGKLLFNEALSGAIQRLEETLDQETAALQEHKVIDLKVFNDRKNHALLELSRALRNISQGPENLALTAQLSSLKGKLEENRRVLKIHLEAVREISTVLSDRIRDADSDGTYSHVLKTVAKP
jgi:hypothetical protein